MAAQYKFTLQRGKTDLKDVTIAAGSAEAQSDTVSVNIDVTSMNRMDALMLLEAIENYILRAPWPPL
ncbi:hypothetical protein [Novosphingobium sp. FKTRR1]|uniref:hypothetical protein n=1 Tax=Novosphingobium sp. FKTRR1 TaxID=2879118 RepID=UPI001CF0125E|nr:hypothetical protein [Novosphingobium sp. FKTRR1]